MRGKTPIHLPAGFRLPVMNPGLRDRSVPDYPYSREPDGSMLSEPRYGVRVERNIYVAMSDGIRIALDLYRPDAEGRFPALLSLGPYTKELQATDSRNPCNEAGDTGFFVSRGYCHVIADCRGSGHSEGSYGVLSDREVEDGAELVEWIAERDWCDGNVGMIGTSYFAILQLLVASKRPPHLRAIFAYDAMEDGYREIFYHGGKLCAGFPVLWLLMVLLGNAYWLRRSAASPDYAAILRIALRVILQRERFDGPFYRERSPCSYLGNIEVPAYLGSSWYMVGIHLRGAFSGWEGIRSKKRMLIGKGSVRDRPWTSYRTELLRWYDHWLKGIDTGVMDGPPVSIMVMGDDRWRGENEWPLARTSWTKLYLHPGGGKMDGFLKPDRPGGDLGQRAYNFSPLSITALLGLPKLTYRTPPLAERVEVTGPIAVTIYASSSARDTTWIVKLFDEDRDGRCRLLTRGWLKASHRETDPDESKPYRPWHPHREETELTPGEIYEFQIEVWPTSNAFHPGHRIRLEISSLDSPIFDFPFFHLPDRRIGTNTVYHSWAHSSHILLPLVDSELMFEE